MSLVRRTVVAGVTLALGVLGAGAVAPAAQASTASSFVSMVNSERAAHGLRAYAESGDLASVAYGQARRMAAAQRLYHNPYLASQVSNWRYVGENVGYGPDASALMTAFMNSAPHRANILDHDYTQIGVGTVTVNGTVWVSMVFRDPMYSSSSTSSSTHHSTTHRTGTAAPASHAVTTHSTPRPAARPHRTARPHRQAVPALHVPPGVVCSATPLVASRVRDLRELERDARLVDSTRPLLIGFQCGRSLPMTGVLDPATLRALGAA